MAMTVGSHRTRKAGAYVSKRLSTLLFLVVTFLTVFAFTAGSGSAQTTGSATAVRLRDSRYRLRDGQRDTGRDRCPDRDNGCDRCPDRHKGGHRDRRNGGRDRHGWRHDHHSTSTRPAASRLDEFRPH